MQIELDKDYYLTHNNNGLWIPLEYNQSITQSNLDNVDYQDSIFQDSHDPYNQSPLFMSQINVELTRTIIWQCVLSAPSSPTCLCDHDFSYPDDEEQVNDLNMSPSHEYRYR